LCELLPQDTVIMRTKRSSKADSASSSNINKRAGTDSVYEKVEGKRQDSKTTTASTSFSGTNEVAEEYADTDCLCLDKTQNLDSDATSDDESNQSKLPSINDMFKFIRMGSKTHSMHEYLYPSQKKSIIKEPELISPERKKEIDEAISNCVIEDCLPFGTFRKNGMIKLLNLLAPGYKPQQSQTISRRLSERYKEYVKLLTIFLKRISHLALSTDMWKNKHLVHFLGLTLHFFDDDFNYVTLIVGFRKFIARHLAVNLKNFIQKELTKLEIVDKIVGVTADNASDIVKATSSGFGIRFSCFLHNLNLTLQPLVKQQKKTKEIEEIQISENEYDSMSECESQKSNDDDFELNEDVEDADLEEEDSEDDKDSPGCIVESQSLLSRIRKLVKMIRKCGNICSYAQKQINLAPDLNNIKNFIIDFHIRWNSTFIMLKRVVKLKDIAMIITEYPNKIDGITKNQREKLKKLELTEEDWLLVDILIKVLAPFFEVTKMLSGRQYETLSLSFVTKRILFHSLENTSNDPKEAAVKDFVLTNLRHHLVEKPNITDAQNKIILKAVYLDPVNLKWLNQDEINNTEKDLVNIFKNKPAPPLQNTQKNDFGPNLAKIKSNQTAAEKLASSLGLIVSQVAPIQTDDKRIQDEISFYRKEVSSNNLSFSNFWKKNSSSIPMLASAVRKYCIIPASSIAVESAFSEANFIQRKERSSLSSKNLRFTLVLKSAKRSTIYKQLNKQKNSD